jgi:hypothetical protein
MFKSHYGSPPAILVTSLLYLSSLLINMEGDGMIHMGVTYNQSKSYALYMISLHIG